MAALRPVALQRGWLRALPLARCRGLSTVRPELRPEPEPEPQLGEESAAGSGGTAAAPMSAACAPRLWHLRTHSCPG